MESECHLPNPQLVDSLYSFCSLQHLLNLCDLQARQTKVLEVLVQGNCRPTSLDPERNGEGGRERKRGRERGKRGERERESEQGGERESFY